jgi:hypothetical protein
MHMRANIPRDKDDKTYKSKCLTGNTSTSVTRPLLFIFCNGFALENLGAEQHATIASGVLHATVTSCRLAVFDFQVTATTELYLGVLQRWACEILLTRVSGQT